MSGEKWRVRDERQILADRWIDLRAQSCVTPSGVEIAPYYILNYPDWVHVVALTERDELVLVREYRHGAQAFCLGPPAGVVDPGDADPLDAARRELAEEAGFSAQNWRKIASLAPEPSRQTNQVHIFLASGLQPLARRKLDPGEEGMTVEITPVAEVLSGLASGKIIHAGQISSLLLGLAAAGRLTLG